MPTSPIQKFNKQHDIIKPLNGTDNFRQPVAYTTDHNKQDKKKAEQTSSPTSSGHSMHTIVSVISANEVDSRGICWFYPPSEDWDLAYYWTLRGAENFHIYVWALKDLSWMQLWYWPGMIAGAGAVTWSAYLLIFHAMWDGNYWEIIFGTGQFVWLFGNYWWMTGELHDHEYPNEPSIYNQRTYEAGIMLKCAFVFVAIFTLVMKPFGLLKPRVEALNKYDRAGLRPRCRFLFPSWRDYENIHIFFWLGKDVAWNGLIQPMWVIFVIPTFLVSLDFVVTSLFNKYAVIDHAHYVSVMLWVLGNAVWACGELWFGYFDTAYPLTARGWEPLHTARWWSSWVMISAYTSIVILYTIWMYWSCYSHEGPNMDTYVYDPEKKEISSVDSPTRKKNANPIPISKHKAPAKPADVAIAVSGVRYGAESL